MLEDERLAFAESFDEIEMNPIRMGGISVKGAMRWEIPRQVRPPRQYRASRSGTPPLKLRGGPVAAPEPGRHSNPLGKGL